MKNRLLVLFSAINFSVAAQPEAALSEKAVYQIMDKNAGTLLKNSKANSVSIGIVKDGKVYTRHYGEIDKGKGNKADNNTLFEVASITKIFTGTLIAQAVLDKKISLDDDIRKYMTGSYPNLQYRGTPITVKDLVSFKSGLEKDLPDNRALIKNETDSTPFYLSKMEQSYTREQFFKDLKNIKLDTMPGKIYKYSNASVQLAAHILENVYHKSYETLLKEHIFSKLGLNSTKLDLAKGDVIANGYNGNQVLMPYIPKNLWGASGSIKSTMNDLTRFLAFEMDRKNKVAAESRRNILNSDSDWNGYFWDNIWVDGNGLNGWKHGGAFGTQNMFAVFPEINLGISVIVNISDRANTSNALGSAVLSLTQDLKSADVAENNPYGYIITGDNVTFRYRHPKKLDFSLVKSVSVAGSFNNWNPEDKAFRMVHRSGNTFELTLPKSRFEKGKNHLFKFVINKTGWVAAPQNAVNVDSGEDRNLILKTD